MAHVLWEVFDWPSGIIVGNLLASLVWSSVFEWRLKVHHAKTREHVLRLFREHSTANTETVIE